MTPGRKLSAATSDSATIRLAKAAASGSFRFKRTDSLLADTWSNVAADMRP
ncbi:hypothetical protein D3C85_1088450 [compost metagenome]